METNTEFAASLELDYPILSDPEKRVATAYGVLDAKHGLPKRWTFFIGKDGKILYVDKDVDPRNHGAQIVARLRELEVEAAPSEKQR